MVSMRVGVAVEAGRVAIVAVKRRRVVWAAETAYTSPEELSSALAALGAERPRGARFANVVLADPVARLKTVAGIPRLKHRDLAAHVQLHSRRYFLQNGIPLVTDVVPARRRRNETGSALMAAAHLPVVEAISTGLVQSGMRLASISPAPEVSSAEVPEPLADRGQLYALAYAATRGPTTPLSLLPPALRVTQVSALRRSLRAWVLAAAASCFLLAAAWIGRAVLQQRRSLEELEQMSASAGSAMAVRRDLDATTEAIGVLASAEQRKHHRTRFIANLTQALPDSAFLVSLRFEPTSGVLSGYARRAADVMARMEQARIAARLVMEGPVTREVVGGREWERFSIRFEVAQ